MKYILILVIVAACTIFGYLLSHKYKKRRDFFNSLIMFSNKLSVDINFSRQKLAGVVESFDKTYSKNLYGIKENYLTYLASKDELSKESLFSKNSPASNEEKDLIFLFFKCQIGRASCRERV